MATALSNAAYTNSGWTFSYAVKQLARRDAHCDCGGDDSQNLTTTIGSKTITM